MLFYHVLAAYFIPLMTGRASCLVLSSIVMGNWLRTPGHNRALPFFGDTVISIWIRQSKNSTDGDNIQRAY